jgi:hypothetical protein
LIAEKQKLRDKEAKQIIEIKERQAVLESKKKENKQFSMELQEEVEGIYIKFKFNFFF